MPFGSQWLLMGILPYLPLVLQLVLSSWIPAYKPFPVRASTLLSQPIALSLHSGVTRALPGMNFDSSPAQSGEHEQYRDHSQRGRMDRESLAMPLALMAKEVRPIPVASGNKAPLLQHTAHWVDEEGRNYPGAKCLSRSFQAGTI